MKYLSTDEVAIFMVNSALERKRKCSEFSIKPKDLMERVLIKLHVALNIDSHSPLRMKFSLGVSILKANLDLAPLIIGMYQKLLKV